MARKRWTPNEDVTDSLLKFREKRKWQLALRRYVLEKNIALAYAPYFGLDIENFRKWIELQLINGLTWGNFASQWQFDHIVPMGYFDFSNQDDLKLCWNFINIRVEQIEHNKMRGNRVDVLAVKAYFETLFIKTAHPVCAKMLLKINQIEVSNIISEPALENFISEKKGHFEILNSLSPEEFSLLNRGKTLADIMLEREILRKFG